MMLNLTKSFMLAAVCAVALPAAASAKPNVDGNAIDMTYTSLGRAADVASSLPVGGITTVTDLTANPTATGTCTATPPNVATCPGIFNDAANLGGGDDIAKFAAQGRVAIDGGTGDDQAYAWGIGTTLTGAGGDDLLLGSADGTSTVHGGGGADRIWAYGAGTNITGDAGRDTIVVHSNWPTVDGGDGNDTIAMTWYAVQGTVAGGNGNDLLTAFVSANRFAMGGATYGGGAGNDTINTFGNGSGRDFVNCGDGNDTVYADAADVVAADCETVVLAAPPAGSPIANAVALGAQYEAAANAIHPSALVYGPIAGF